MKFERGNVISVKLTGIAPCSIFCLFNSSAWSQAQSRVSAMSSQNKVITEAECSAFDVLDGDRREAQPANVRLSEISQVRRLSR